MTPKQRSIVIVFAAVVFLGIILGVVLRNGEEPVPEAPAIGGAGSQPAAPEDKSFSSNVAANIPLTKADTSVPAAPNSDAQLGIYSVTVDRNGFHPDTIAVKLGDVVHIKLTAKDGNYDFVMPYNGLSQTVKQGETAPVNFGATTAGTFVFKCQNLCPSGKVIEGQLVVKP